MGPILKQNVISGVFLGINWYCYDKKRKNESKRNAVRNATGEIFDLIHEFMKCERKGFVHKPRVGVFIHKKML